MTAPLLTDDPRITWRACAFDELTLRELQHIYRARQTVFVVEQNCPYLDADGVDEHSHHVAAWAHGDAMPLACARVVAPGVKYAEPSIGRVVTTAAARGTGLGRELMRRAIALADALYPGQGLRISAQSYLEGFYGGFGFQIVGERYLEDDIPHTEMLRRAG